MRAPAVAMALILGLPIQGQSTDTLLFESNRTSFGTQAVVFEPGSPISYGVETTVLGNGGVSGSYSFPSAVMGALHALPDGVHLVSRGGWLHGGIGSGVLLHSTHTVESVAADPENHAFLIVGTSKADCDSRLFQDHSGTLKLASTFEGPRGVQCLHRVDTRLFLVAAGTHSTEIHTTVNPAAGGSTNAPPVAALGSSPPEATTAAALRFDAGAPSDESPTSLRYRWDWESDGRYDTEWTNAPVQEHRFLNGDKDSVRLQMKDSFGATSRVQRSVEVVTVPDPGIPAESHEPFALPFRAADIAFDPGAPFAYLADTNTLRILRMDLRTGLADRQYVLDKWPLKLALSPDGDTLIVALSPSARLMRTGYVAEFALPTAVKRREYPIDTGLSALMVGPDDLLIGSAPEGIVVYRLGETRRLDQESTSLVSSFTPSPSPTNFYAFNAFGISRWELDATTGRLHPEGTLSITSQIGDDLFLIPGGTNALSGAGRLLASAPLAPPSQDLKTVRTVHTGRVEAVTFDLPRRALFLLGTASSTPPLRTNLYHYHLDSQLFLGTFSVTNGTRYLKAYADHLFTVAIRTNGTFFHRIPNPAANSESNHPPVAHFEVSPAQATTLQTVTFDGAGSMDEDDGSNGLQYRWDWDGDGSFETDFAPISASSHRFNLAGTHVVVLEVRDRHGASARTSRPVTVTSAEDPGHEPSSVSPPFTLPFAPKDLVFDPVRPRLFAANAEGKAVVRMDLTTGLVDRVYSLDYHPDAMAISADGKRLGVTTLHRTTYTAPPSPWKGFVAHFDLERDVKTHEFGLTYIPRSVSVTSHGYAILGGHGTATAASGVHLHRLSTGEEVYVGAPYATTRSTVHPDQSRFYSVITGTSRPSAYGFAILDDGSVTRRDGFGGDFMSDWIEMLGAHRLISGWGGVYASSTDPILDGTLLAVLDEAVYDVAPDVAHHAFFVAGAVWGGSPVVRLHHASTLEVGREWAVPEGTRFVHATSNTVFWVTVSAATAAISQIPNPAAGGETNQTPVARFEFTPSTPIAGQAIHFDAGLTSDDGGPGNLRYRWDWDADGIFDTPALSEASVTNLFEFAGTRTIVLKVVDGFGQTNIVGKTLHIDAGSKVGPVAFELSFPSAGFLFHPTQRIAFALDATARRVVRVDLQSGHIVDEVALLHPPAALTLTPDATRLMVALRRRFSPDSEGEGTIVVLDPDTLAVRSEFDVDMDPADLVATDDGIVIATSGSGQWTAVRSFRADSGERLGSAPVYYQGRLALHPSQRTFYVSTTASNPPEVSRFDLDPQTGIITMGGASGAAAGDVFPAPNGTEIVSASGALLRASVDPAQDLQVLLQIAEATFLDLDHDTASGLAFGIGKFWADSTFPRLVILGSDYRVLNTEPMPAATRFVHAAAPYLYTADVEAKRILLHRRIHPTASLQLIARSTTVGEPAVEIELRGLPGQGFVLSQTQDLRSWTPIQTNRLDHGSWSFRPAASEKAAFYRAEIRTSD